MPAHKRTPKRTGAPRASAKPARAAAPGRPLSHAEPGGAADYPAAGPHARPHLTDPDRTPGTGALADPARPRDPDATG